MSSFTHCPTLDDYRKVFTELENRGLVFAYTTVPLAKENYIKQESWFFTRVTKEEYEQFNNSENETENG